MYERVFFFLERQFQQASSILDSVLEVHLAVDAFTDLVLFLLAKIVDHYGKGEIDQQVVANQDYDNEEGHCYVLIVPVHDLRHQIVPSDESH